MPRKPSLRRSNGYWYPQAGCRDGVYLGRIDEVPYQVARTRFGEYLATLNRNPNGSPGLPKKGL